MIPWIMLRIMCENIPILDACFKHAGVTIGVALSL